MKFTDFLQSFLFRDIISYVAPGVLLLALLVFGFDLTHVAKKAYQHSGSVNSFLVLFLVSYIGGYINYSIMMKLRNEIGWTGNSKKLKLPDSVLSQLKNILRDQFSIQSDELTLMEVSHLSANMLHIRNPEIFSTMIERLLALRNFNVSLSGVVLFGAVVVALKAPLELKWAAFPVLVLSAFHLYKSGLIQDVIRADSIRMLYISLIADRQNDISQNEDVT